MACKAHKSGPRGAVAGIACLILAASWGTGPAHALPENGRVRGGQATIEHTGEKRLDIRQGSGRAVMEWQRFDIERDEEVHIHQPGRDSVLLNRITGGDPSRIDGQLNANGHVWLMNPSGVMFGRGANVNVAGLLATTSQIGTEEFMAGRYRFGAASSPGSVVNEGRITAENGSVGLLAREVRNDGTINARLGHVTLGAADSYTIDFYGDGLMNFSLDPLDPAHKARAHLQNAGEILADGGTVTLSAAGGDAFIDRLVTQSGIVRADSVSRDARGNIVLSAGPVGALEISGTLQARGLEDGRKGGTIRAGGDTVHIRETASIDASGDQGGGKILVGATEGGTDAPPAARQVLVNRGALLAASAVGQGDGGQIYVFASEATLFRGQASARGGRLSGNGGFIDVSSLKQLGVQGQLDVGAPNGTAGTVAFDPDDVTVIPTGPFNDDAEIADGVIRLTDSPGSGFVINPDAIEALSGAAVISAANSVAIVGNLTTANLTSLTLLAPDVTINAPITATATTFTLDTRGAARTIINAPVHVNGDLRLFVDNAVFNAPVTATGTITIEGAGNGSTELVRAAVVNNAETFTSVIENDTGDDKIVYGDNLILKPGELLRQAEQTDSQAIRAAFSAASAAAGEPERAAGIPDEGAFVIREGQEMIVRPGEYAIQPGDILITAARQSFRFNLPDGSEIALGAGTEMRVGNFLQNRPGSRSDQFLTVTNGAARFISGTDAAGEIRAAGPGVAIGIKGTCYVVDHDKSSGRTRITLFGGALELYVKGGLIALNSPIQSIEFATGSGGPKVQPVSLTMDQVRSMYTPDILPSAEQIRKCQAK